MIQTNRRRISVAALASALTLLMNLTLGSAELRAQQPPTARSPVRDSTRTFRRFPKSWMEIKRQNIVMQQRDFSCGAAALATMLTYHIGDKTSEYQLLVGLDELLTQEELLERIQKGLTLTDLRRLSNKFDYNASILKMTLQGLAKSKTPIIVGIVVNEYDHFVVFRGLDGKYVYLADPARGNLRVPIREFLGQWQQNLGLVVVPKDDKPVEWSPLMLQPGETYLGRTNRLYLRDRLTTGPGSSGN
ncbi:MAG: C39 family peptidase [Pirellulales bacterium]|nr:C39 family peptidase [Pirellulales bacterium]